MTVCSWKDLRLWHTQRNWMGKTNKLENPYSSSQTLFACLLPLSLFIFFVIYGIIDSSNEDDDHIVEVRDASPFWRLSSSYYTGMHQDIYFNYNQEQMDLNYPNQSPPNITLHQYYVNTFEQRLNFKCEDIVDENPKTAMIEGTSPYVESLSLDTTPFGTICYHTRTGRARQNYGGLVLCRNDNQSSIVPIGLFVYDSRDSFFRELYRFDWKPMQSIVITLQLWQQFDNGGLSAEWINNEIEVKSIEYNDDQELWRPSDDEGNEGKCYGLRVVMDRSVYQVYDGKNAFIGFGNYISLIGAVYSFFILSFGICSKCLDKIIERFFVSLHEKDTQLMMKNDDLDVQMEQTVKQTES